MSLFLKKYLAVFLTVIIILNAGGCAVPYKTHPEFKQRHKNIRTVSLMPPEVDAYVLTFKGDKTRLHDLIPIMEKTTIEQLEQILTDKGYVLKKLDLSEENLEAKPDLRTSLFHVNELFKKALNDIAKRKQRKFTYTLGSEVNIFADLAGCDVLIFVKEEGVKKSTGEVVKDVVKGVVLSAACLLIGAIYVPIPQTVATVVHIAVVDSNDGAILWYINNSSNVNYNPENQKHIARLIKSMIKYFPDSAFKEKKKGIAQKLAEEIEEKKSVVPIVTDPLAVQQ
ncbi:MAG: hypothetical protein JSV93_06340 [Candidatus Omnitrophota bacterium]|nr:MAG: hypothetical protein JSV93_06340 [Candidatus Omnitrophota bacterium]